MCKRFGYKQRWRAVHEGESEVSEVYIHGEYEERLQYG